MVKKFLIILIFFILFFASGSYLILSDSDLSKDIKKLIPNNLKSVLKETIFIIPDLRRENKLLHEKVELISRDITILKKGNDNMLGLKIYKDPFQAKLNDSQFSLTKFFLTGNPHNFAGYQDSEFYKGKYIEKSNRNLIILDSFNFYSTPINENIFNKEKITIEEIETDIKEFTNLVGIRDTKVIEDEIYLYGIFKNLDCFYAQILKSKINFNKINNKFDKFKFNIVFKFNFCEKNAMQSGGRIDEFKNDYIIVSIGDYGALNWDAKEDYFFSDQSNLGKIISINLISKEIDVLSKGHRNPQGLIYVDKKNLIINTEHGPKGGDEININTLDTVKNFGWPIASYGIRYNGDDPFEKNHKNFSEPIKYYNPSIAPSQIIKKFNHNSFIFATLKDKSLHEIEFSNDFTKLINQKRFLIDERIRDIIHVQKGVYALILDNSPSLAFLKFNE